ncbi:MAG: rod shape-determining protein MreC [Kiritimatiellae bacterium]|nr:rod shape-determining protein MreC [Kiritimatiellia bacterium]
MTVRKYLICLILLAVVVLLNLPLPVSMRIKSVSRDDFAPFQNIMSLIISKVRRQASYLTDTGRILDEKRKMILEITNLRYKLKQLETLDSENEKLRKHLNFARGQEHRLIMCEVIGRGGASGWWRTLTVNMGSNEGIRPNMAVTTLEGLVGKTLEVTKLTSSVLLITDPNCKISCKFVRTGSFGIIKGLGMDAFGKSKLDMLCRMPECGADYVSADKRIIKDDVVVTSGLGGTYPEGLLIGRAVNAQMDSSRLYQQVDIVPALDMNSLKYVFIVDIKPSD